MKVREMLPLAMLMLVMLAMAGCGSDSSPTDATANSVLQGQFVAESGVQLAKLAANPTPRAAGDLPAPVYPVSGATVELWRDGVMIATTTTDEYGRFQFIGLTPGNYEVRTTANDGSVAHYHVYVDANQTVTVYGRAVVGDCYWEQEYGPHWDEMPAGPHWGNGFQGASPGVGYWHNGQIWCEPQGSGPHGPHS